MANLDKVRHSKGPRSTAASARRAAEGMQRGTRRCSACRSPRGGLQEGRRRVRVVRRDRDHRPLDGVEHRPRRDALELQNLLVQGAQTVYSAEARKESRGAHARDDFQSRDDETWMKHTLSWKGLPSDPTKLAYRPVHYYTLDEEECADRAARRPRLLSARVTRGGRAAGDMGGGGRPGGTSLRGRGGRRFITGLPSCPSLARPPRPTPSAADDGLRVGGGRRVGAASSAIP